MTSLNITRQSIRINFVSLNRTSSARVSPAWSHRAWDSFRVKPRLIHSGPTPSPPPPKKRALVDIALIAAGFLSIGVTVLWLQSTRQKKTDDPLFGAVQNREQFEIPIASHTGSPGAKKILTMLSTKEVDQLLKKYETTFSVDREGNPVYRYDTNHVASNAPIEDDSLCAVMTRDQSESDPKSFSKPSPKDMLFFGVFDGHSGWQTSKLLAEQLLPAVNRELHSVFRSEPEYVTAYLAKQLARAHLDKKVSDGPREVQVSKGLMEKIWNIVTWNNRHHRTVIDDLDQDDDIVKLAIQNAFTKLDNQIVGRPIQMLATYEAQRKSGEKSIPKDYGSEVTPQQTASLQALLPALSGSCALLAYIDTLRSKVHVACTGDSRAVMGVWDPKANQGKGKWKAQLLSEDQEGLNPREVERMRSEHPPSERENVIRRGRVLGGLQPTRAFGDARYKWPVGIQEKLYEAFHPSGRARRDPPDYLTPPYVTARPEIVTTSIPSPSETDKPAFVVLATDGLWDRLETAEVVGLVGRWIEMGGQHPSLLSSKQQVLGKKEVAAADQVEVICPPGGSLPAAHDPHSSSEQSFIFEDTNVATHLIRNALGGASREKVGALLSIPAPHSRRYRDDITVTVVFIDPQKSSQNNSGRDGDRVVGEGITKTKPELIGVPKL
ncbi:hypothetical protein MJO28_005821 [Puccinia striiformis f. sp. tritici]|uniref:PPM-type phosphatase domain-containing protein n=3 Tax=Puccinia striiformis f. sp. tritici TaxID=168172 RepID=A0A0L0UT14_9BASI|nr:uncharacterized protein Pst134EA_031444 [Puccinia striiformis f. sp. tritici]KAH9442791.1 hypothetical protein Pst134EA_031444 [Puccinia striiformis f. sp. tritici]KAH9458744.1 hypothetical protein Pst134EB_011038 [Puccinia striiformis f. sp. tritici]KAI7955421.1 hypothetical protein MJO28_005821 [Puccinia striiformis f. sp. tritici]KNE90051.1 hypothetical protein PSTG_16496 [Puccinia striiformis f. sp. tritici PST-78]